MKKVLLLTTFLFLFIPQKVSAHPLDVTTADVYLNKGPFGKNLNNDQLIVNIQINPTQGKLVVDKLTTDNINNPKDLLNYEKPFINYTKNNIKIKNENSLCNVRESVFYEYEPESVPFNGVQIIHTYNCSKKLNNITLTNSLFINDFPLQNNVTQIFNNGELLKGFILTTNNKTQTVNVPELLNKKSKGDSAVNYKPPQFLQTLSNKFGTAYKNSFWLAVGIVFLLGLLHTLEAGHSKMILTSAMVSKNMNLKGGLSYALIFTLTHLADILLLGVAFIIADSFIDIYSKLSFIKVFALYSLFFISLYLFFQNGAEFIKSYFTSNNKSRDHNHEHSHDHTHEELNPNKSLKDQLILGLVTGLSPCLFGWSIFMIVLSSENLINIFPIVISFGLGIFIALAAVVILVDKFKVKLFGKYSWVGKISPVISSLMLVVFSLILLLG